MFSKEEIKNAIRKAQVSNEQETEDIINRVQIEVQEDIEEKKRRARIRYLIYSIILIVILTLSGVLTDLISLLSLF